MTRRTLQRRARTAFSLIELLVVIVIIAIVIAITVPAIGAARDLARNASVEATTQSLTTAVSAFRADEQRSPGYFTAADMGDNSDGFTAMQNVMLDLAGGPVEPGASASALTVGPNNRAQAEVSLSVIGGEAGAGYFDPGAGDYTVAEGKAGASTDNNALPELIDPWGTPLMAWQEDEFAPDVERGTEALNRFAQVQWVSTSPARFYWDQNRPLLRSTALGSRETDQSDSLLNAASAGDQREALAALLGSPAAPVLRSATGNLAGANIDTLAPSLSRGSIVFHSAGRDRVFLSSADDGLRRIGGHFGYGHSFSPKEGGRYGVDTWPNADGTDGFVDLLDGFNDVVVGVAR
jgi:prepilin-type N-terminal cleavage/methylation domain-containing protein